MRPVPCLLSICDLLACYVALASLVVQRRGHFAPRRSGSGRALQASGQGGQRPHEARSLVFCCTCSGEGAPEKLPAEALGR